MSQTASKTATYTEADILRVTTSVRADLMMIGDSTGLWTPQGAQDRAHDIEELAKAGYLKRADIMLYSNGVEVRAVRFDVNVATGGLTSSRPGGVRWPRVVNPELRVVLTYTEAYTTDSAAVIATRLKISWGPTTLDTSHASLSSANGRSYISNSYGIQRKDWGE